ncbi:flagellar biosynthetic protein FliQ [Sphingosinicella terrae]|uniref:flagellar biosynthetic protein FliQ n=1 Tax=Sphingosinicella terrae TaxID=2172047 RepID=UPI000E0DE52B|nr:flagellar biosynthetic protein FliQ [Sphingosinicella terrae]
MSPGDTLALAKAALLLVLTIAGPMLIASLIIGVFIGLVQALTQIQEMTLTFVPKILVMGLVMLMSLPMIGQALSAFMTEVSARIVSG